MLARAVLSGLTAGVHLPNLETPPKEYIALTERENYTATVFHLPSRRWEFSVL
jgi:hypothetical protein